MRRHRQLNLHRHTFAALLLPLTAGELGCLPDPPIYSTSASAQTAAPPVSSTVVVPTSPEGGLVEGTVAAGVRWMGRVDLTTDPAKPYFGWTASGFAAKFSGTSIGVTLNTEAVPDQNCQTAPCGLFFQPVVDGVVLERMKATPGTATLAVASGLADGPHTLEFYRESESPYGTSQFVGITGGSLLPPPTYSGRLIEFVADSITNGFGELGEEPHPDYSDFAPCPFTLDTQAGYLTYAAKLARALNADPSIVALSGWGLYRGLDLGNEPTTYAMPLEYTDSRYNVPPQPQWDFRVKANAVVINLGTNDIAAGDPGANFTTALTNLVAMIRAKNPGAWIFPVTGTMLSGQGHAWVKQYFEDFVAAEGGDAARITYVDLGIQDPLLGTGCIWHPSVQEHQRMVDVLYPVVKAKLGW